MVVDLFESYSSVNSMSDEQVKKEYNVPKVQVLKVLKKLLITEIVSSDAPVKEKKVSKPRKPRTPKEGKAPRKPRTKKSPPEAFEKDNL